MLCVFCGCDVQCTVCGVYVSVCVSVPPSRRRLCELGAADHMLYRLFEWEYFTVVATLCWIYHGHTVLLALYVTGVPWSATAAPFMPQRY